MQKEIRITIEDFWNPANPSGKTFSVKVLRDNMAYLQTNVTLEPAKQTIPVLSAVEAAWNDLVKGD